MILPWTVSCERNTCSCCQIGELVYAETRPYGEFGEKRTFWVNGRRLGVANNDDQAMEFCEKEIRSLLCSFPGIEFVKKGPLEIKVGNIEKEEVEAIFCPWGKDTGLAGVSSCVIRDGGPEMLGFMRRIDTIKVGQARISTSGNLPCKFVIHVACPQWRGGTDNEVYQLEEAYSACISGLKDLVIKEAALPCLGMGGNAFPEEKALLVLAGFVKYVLDSRMMRRLRIITPSKAVFWDLRSILMEEMT